MSTLIAFSGNPGDWTYVEEVLRFEIESLDVWPPGPR
jgi:hypothetical protein